MPYDAETERAILGSILLDNSVFTVALDAGLTGSDFFSAGNQFIWEAMLALRHRDESIDALTLCAELGRSGALQRIGGRARISALIDGLPNAANVAHYAAIVKRHAASRHLIRACDETIDEARVADQAPAALSERLRARLDAICVTGVVHSGLEIRSLASILEDPEALRPPTVVVPRLAWAGRVTLLAAREKGGKSTTATASAAAVSRGGSWLDAVTATGSVIWFGLEEHTSDLVARVCEWDADPKRVHVLTHCGRPATHWLLCTQQWRSCDPRW